MQKRLRKFMDKMQERSLEERRKVLFTSMVFLGIVITFFGVSNIFSNLVSLGGTSDNLASVNKETVEDTPSLFSSLSSNVASVWGGVLVGLKDLNDKLGSK